MVRLDEVEALPTFGELKWKPLRRPLGVTAFGVNAYWAGSPGDELIEEHDELGAGAGKHEELYVVIGGSARFIVAGDEFEAPTGTVVFVRDPAARRGGGRDRGEHDCARDWRYPRATVRGVAVGVGRGGDSRPGAVGITQRPRATIENGLREYPENPSLLYDLACLEALMDETEAAIEHLRRAVELKPEYAKDALTRGGLRLDPRPPRLPPYRDG